MSEAVCATVIEPAVAVKVPFVALVSSVTDGGTLRTDKEVLVSEMTAPPDGAGADRVIVQLVLAPAPKPVGLHCKEETVVPGAVMVPVLRLNAPLVDVKKRVPSLPTGTFVAIGEPFS